MGPEHFWWGGWSIFPVIMPLAMVIVVVAMLYCVFGRGGCGPSWRNDSDKPSNHSQGAETAIDILKKRYAKGELTREEFEQMKRDIQNG